MPSRATVGISDLSPYMPAPMMGVDDIVRRRILDNPWLNRHLKRTVRMAGQEAIRFPEPWKDSATLAAQEALGLSGTFYLAGVREDEYRQYARERATVREGEHAMVDT